MTYRELWNWVIDERKWIKDSRTDTEYKIKIIDRVIYIGFQGSSSFKDWLYNICINIFPIIRKPYKKMKPLWFAHWGFSKKWKAVKKEVFEVLVAADKNNEFDKIVVTGHSQGGGIALLCHEDIWFNFAHLRSILNTTVFGAPRTVWFWNYSKVEDRFNKVIRIERRYDIVPKLPPILSLYRHVGNSKKVGKIFPPNFRFIHLHVSYNEVLE